MAHYGSVAAAMKELDAKSTAKPLTFSAFAAQWLRDFVDVNNKSSEQYTKRNVLTTHLLPAFGNFPLEAITRVDVERFKAEAQKKGLKAKSINNYLSTLRCCLTTAVDWELLTRAPVIRPLKAMKPSFRYLSQDELGGLVHAAGESVWRDAILIAVRTGVRFGELAALEWSDVDFKTRILTIQRSHNRHETGTPKNSRIRHVPIPSDALALLAAKRRPEGLILRFEGRPLSKTGAYWHLQNICRAAGIKPHGWHVLRHTYASYLTQRGVTSQVLMELLGHQSLAMVLRYAHLAPDAFMSAVAVLDPQGSPQWQPTGNPEPIRSLFTPRSHAFINGFAAVESKKHHAPA